MTTQALLGTTLDDALANARTASERKSISKRWRYANDATYREKALERARRADRSYRRTPDYLAKGRSYSEAWRARNAHKLEEIRERHRLRAFKLTHGVTREQADAMIEAQSGLCAICGTKPQVILRADSGTPSGASRLQLDHDHATGKTRAMLCPSCNKALGFVRDDKALLKKMIAYLEAHS